MKRSYRDNKPRFHKHRQGKMLLPHNLLSGFFITVNPQQESHAKREAQLYLSTLTRDLEAAQEAFGKCDAPPDVAGADRESAALVPSSAPLSSLLAEELDACRAHEACGNRFNVSKRRRTEESSDDEEGVDNSADHGRSRSLRRGAAQRRGEWFAPLETGCKGYLFLNVPIVNAGVTCPTYHVASDLAPRPAGAESECPVVSVGAPTSPTLGDGALPPHTIVVNPIVSRITERIFEDLVANPRPIFRNCFRLIPAELTCCPTLPEMQTALRALLALHFAPEAVDGGVLAEEGVNFDCRIPLPSWGTNLPRRSMYTIALQLIVKNNTNVEQKKSALASALAGSIPANRFIVVAQPSQKAKCSLDAVVCVFVAHATCIMGVQRCITARHGFNLHAVGGDALVLTNAVHSVPKKGYSE